MANGDASVRVEQLGLPSEVVAELKNGASAAVVAGERATGAQNLNIVLFESANKYCSLTSHSKVTRKRAGPAERIKRAGVSSRAAELATRLEERGALRGQNASDVVKANETYPLENLTDDQQCQVIERVIENRVFLKAANDNEVVHLALQHGASDDFLPTSWYAAVVSYLGRVLDWMDVPDEVFGQLSQSQLGELVRLLTAIEQKRTIASGYSR